MNIKRKLLKFIPLSIILTSSLTFLISCSNIDSSKPKYQKDYDFGLVSNPLNNLNYVKFKSMDKVLPSLVIPFVKSGPTEGLKSIIQIGKFTSSFITQNSNKTAVWDEYIKSNKKNLADQDGLGGYSGNYYSLDDFGLIGGIGYNSNDGTNNPEHPAIWLFRNPKNNDKFLGFTGSLNNKLIRWSNGDFITATDILDYIHYIFDLNTGSQHLAEYQKWSIRGTEEFLNAQIEYAQKFQVNYQNPFGLRRYIQDPNNKDNYIQDPNQKVWNSQNKGDEKEVERIKNAALKFGLYSGRMFLDYDNDLIKKNIVNNPKFDYNKEIQDFVIVNNGKKEIIKLVKNSYFSPDQIVDPKTLETLIKSLPTDENQFNMIFEEYNTPDISALVFKYAQSIYPINRKYVETKAGGISKYGSEPNDFLTAGPFNIDKKKALLGQQGYIYLNKNKEYYDAKNTISNRIKILFSNDKTINATFFEDGIISQTYIPASKIHEYWSDKVMRNFLNKNSGYGTIAYAFNLDNQTNAASYVQDQDLRNAIYYAINRDSVLKTVGWDFSFPVNNWTSFQTYKTADGKALELFFDGKKARAKNNEEFPIQNYNMLAHLSKSYTFESLSRVDASFSKKTALFYLNKFKAKHPELESVSIKFINNSSDEQKRAGIYLQEALRRNLDDFVKLEIKSLPENTYVSFVEEGKFDIIYQNYDKLGGNAVQDYVAVFFKPDELDKYIEKSIGFVSNPVGSYTYADWFANMIIDKNKQQDPSYNYSTEIEPIFNEISIVASKIGNYQEALNTNNYFVKNSYIKNNLQEIKKQYLKLHEENKKLITNKFIEDALEYLLTNEAGIKESRIKRVYIIYIFNKYGVDNIFNMTKDTMRRLDISDRSWKKLIDLSFMRNDETISDYSNRISSFFTGNFTTEEEKEQWPSQSDYNIFNFIATLEKAVRDMSAVIPLMEVDTNWELTKVGGVNSLFKFDLQYAYDYTNPPRPALPRNRGQS